MPLESRFSTRLTLLRLVGCEYMVEGTVFADNHDYMLNGGSSLLELSVCAMAGEISCSTNVAMPAFAAARHLSETSCVETISLPLL